MNVVALGTVVLPKSVTPKRIDANIKESLKVKKQLDGDQEELKRLNAIAPGGKQHRFIKPPWGIPMGFPDWN